MARRPSRRFKFVWVGTDWRGVYTMGRTVDPTYWVQAFAHELMHATGYTRGTLPLPGTRLHGWVSTREEELVADAGAVLLCRRFGVVPDMAAVREGMDVWCDAVAAELEARMALLSPEGGLGAQNGDH